MSSCRLPVAGPLRMRRWWKQHYRRWRRWWDDELHDHGGEFESDEWSGDQLWQFGDEPCNAGDDELLVDRELGHADVLQCAGDRGEQ